MEKIIEQVSQWQYLKELPSQLLNFKLSIQQETCDCQYKIFSYHNGECQRAFTVLYDKTTKEYLARVSVGLTEYCDINYIAGSLELLEQLLRDGLEQTLARLEKTNKEQLGSIFNAKKIVEWPYAVKLSPEIAGFKLFIGPTEPVVFINGSYIIINYVDFAAESDLVIYYNIYRDEFFGEIRKRRTPNMITVFDAKELVELEGKLTKNLESVLLKLRSQLKSE